MREGESHLKMKTEDTDLYLVYFFLPLILLSHLLCDPLLNTMSSLFLSSPSFPAAVVVVMIIIIIVL